MPLWISQSYFRIVLEEQSCRNSFQYLQCISRAHAQFYPDDAMHMLWLDIQLQNFYFVHCSRPSDTGSYQILLLFLAKHFVPVFCAPFKVPHRYSDAVAPPFISFCIALANQNLCFHFYLHAKRVVALHKVYLREKATTTNVVQGVATCSPCFIFILVEIITAIHSLA